MYQVKLEFKFTSEKMPWPYETFGTLWWSLENCEDTLARLNNSRFEDSVLIFDREGNALMVALFVYGIATYPVIRSEENWKKYTTKV